MDPASQLAAWVATAGAAYLVVGAFLDGVRLIARVRLPGMPSLRPLLAALTVLAMLGRVGPAAATTPPPAQRLGGGGNAAPAVDAGPVAPLEAAVAAAAVGPGGSHTVERGDTLWSISRGVLGEDARVADVAAYWPLVYQANAAVIGPDPDLILPGQVLMLPEAP